MEIEAFVNTVHSELAHRKQELSQVKLNIQEYVDDAALHGWMTRSASVLSYAHWEGFVKAGSAKYLKFINELRLPVRSLKACFQAASVVSHFKRAENSHKVGHLAEILAAIDIQRAGMFNVNPQKIIDTGHNLSSNAFIAIACGLGLTPLPWLETRIGFIDATLVYGRHQVAHGELITVSPEEAVERIDGVISLIHAYSDQLIEAATSQAYLVS